MNAVAIGLELLPGKIVEMPYYGTAEGWARAHTGGVTNGLLIIGVAARDRYGMLVATGVAATVESLKEATLKPLATYAEHKDLTSQADVNPNYILPKMFMFRLQKIMDEYAGGASVGFRTSEPLLKKGLEYLQFMHEDAEKLATFQDVIDYIKAHL